MTLSRRIWSFKFGCGNNRLSQSNLAVKLSNLIASMSEAELALALQHLTALLRVTRATGTESPPEHDSRPAVE